MLEISLIEKDEDYGKKFCVGLNREGKGKWNVKLFTGIEKLKKYPEHFAIIMLTNLNELERIKVIFKNQVIIYLTSEIKEQEIIENGYEKIYRYQSIKLISRDLKNIIGKLGYDEKVRKTIYAIYSPIGRCGKTTLGIGLAEDRIKNTLYVGMEDYNSLDITREEYIDGNIFYYYVKEKNTDKIKELLKKDQNIITSPNYFGDLKNIYQEDLLFIKKEIENSKYQMIFFDIGSFILANIEWLNIFDYIIVPYLDDALSQYKKKQFVERINTDSDLFRKVKFVNMNQNLVKIKDDLLGENKMT